MDAKTAHAIAKDAKTIKKFKERMNEKIECAAHNGEFYTQEYISWSVSDEAIYVVAEEYESQGFEVSVETRDQEKIDSMSCDNYSERLVRVLWENIRREG